MIFKKEKEEKAKKSIAAHCISLEVTSDQFLKTLNKRNILSSMDCDPE